MISSLIALVAITQAAPLVAGPTYKMPKTGRFDYMLVDNKYKRVFASHPKAGTLAVLDFSTGQASEIETGAVNGIKIDKALDKIFVGGGDSGILCALDRKTLAIEKTVHLDGAGDGLEIDPKRDEIYMCHDESQEVWVYDAKTLNKLASVAVAGAPEWIEYDSSTDKLYQNIKPTDQVQIIDPVTRKVCAAWSTAPEKGPHGLAIDKKTGRVFSAGSNGKMDVFDLNSGRLITTLDIVPHTDQIAFDAKLQRIYCAGAGAITVVQEAPDGGASVLANVPDSAGAHTIAVNAKTHEVWISYSNESGAYFQSFSVPTS
jgi:DNA-binding beta-propeller fold protein YncE